MIKNLLTEHPEEVWTVEEMAIAVGLSVPHFQRLFKHHAGIPPKTYLQDIRLTKAKELLRATFLRVKEIGVKTGLTNESHFTREFKKRFGMTPSEYRRHCWKVDQSHRGGNDDHISQEISVSGQG
jgi:transcriptional regulator GlxA family with amidase domain